VDATGTEGSRPARRWGDDVALLDEDEARRRLLEAASRCVIRRGGARIRMGEVAEEAGVARSTAYRYFPTRDDLIMGLLLQKADAAFARVVAGLKDPRSASRSLPELVLGPLSYIDGSPENEALFSSGSRDFVTSLELRSEPLFEAGWRHFGPLLEQWRTDGQLHPDLDLREALRWIDMTSINLVSSGWRTRRPADQRALLTQYLVRALVRPEHW
jgi:TetR/AcrR family transcriptional regulator